MKTNIITFLVVLLLIMTAFVAFRPTAATHSYSYLAIRSYHPDLDEVYLSIAGKEYKRINLKKQVQGDLDLNPLINVINQYENEGWEMQYITSQPGTTFIWMRKEK